MFALVAGFALIAAPADKPKDLPEAAQKELKKLEGKWKAVKMITSAGEKDQGANPPEEYLVFKGRRLSFEGKERADVDSIDPSTNPKCLDIKAIEDQGPIKKGMVFEAIYKIDGDTLTIAIHIGEEKKRPANFDQPKEEQTMVMVFKRVKD
jgi:uncharacterized protein (TIGR03067 family)